MGFLKRGLIIFVVLILLGIVAFNITGHDVFRLISGTYEFDEEGSSEVISLMSGSSGGKLEKTKAMYVYDTLTEEQLDTLISNGINTIITKYSGLGSIEEEVLEHAEIARRKDIEFIPAFNFEHLHSTSGVTNEKAIYYSDGTLKESIFVPVLSREYWDYLTTKIKNLAEISIDNPEYRIDGAFVDFELYSASNEKRTYFTYDSAYDDSTFSEFVNFYGLQNNPPVQSNRVMERYNWLVSNGRLYDYHEFVRQKAVELSENMIQEVHSVDPDFTIGFYPSPKWETSKYVYPLFLDFLKGFESGPGILYGTDMYSSGGTQNIPDELSLSEGDFVFERKDTGERISIKYLGGFLLRSYGPADFNSIFQTASQTNGYWLFSSSSLFTGCSFLSSSSIYRPKLNCDADIANPSCCNNQWDLSSSTWNANCCNYLADGVEDYWAAIKNTNMRLDGQVIPESDLVFTFWPVNIQNTTNLQIIDDVMETGMTHAGISFSASADIGSQIQSLRDKNYRLALGSTLSVDLTSLEDSGNQFLDAPCLDKTKCAAWNTSRAVNPLYEGLLWQRALGYLGTRTQKSNPELVLYDLEIWNDPVDVEYYFNAGDSGRDCNCNIIEEGIGYDAYYVGWKQRGDDLVDAVKEENPDAEIYFYHEIPFGGNRTLQNYAGNLKGYTTGDVLAGTGDSPSPSLYVLPNLEVLEKNTESMNLYGAVPWVSFSYMYGFSNYGGGNVHFDPGVSREAGRMLRNAGAKGFLVYPSPLTVKSNLGGEAYQSWLLHAEEMIAGFKEAPNYVEENKIRNPDFEAFKAKTESYSSNSLGNLYLIGGTQFSPVFWTWSDSNPDYSDNEDYSNLSTDSASGEYSWEHKRKGDLGYREIYSDEFNLDDRDYAFSMKAKANINSANGKIKVSLVNQENLEEELISETNFVNSWTNISKSWKVNSGDYKLKIYIEDNTNQETSILFDDVNFKEHDTDLLNLANGENILFVDINNPACRDDYTKNQSMNPQTPFCSIQSAINSGLLPGDTVYVHEGIYNEGLRFFNGGEENNYITLKAYPGETPIINLGVSGSVYNWAQNGNKYTTVVDNLDSNSIRVIEKNSYATTRVNTLEELNSPNLESAGEYNLFYFNNLTKGLTVKLNSTTPEDISLVDGYRRITLFAPYIEINGFVIQHGYDGIKATYLDKDKGIFEKTGHYARIINNTIQYIADQGILTSGAIIGMEIYGNNFSYFGEPLKYHPYEPYASEFLLIQNNLDHAVYFTGTGAIIKSNYMENCYGSCMHPWATNNSYPRDSVIESNIIKGGVAISGTNNLIKNNLIFDYLSVWPESGSDVFNNFINGYLRFGYFSPVRDLDFKNNIVLGGRDPCIETGLTDLASANFSNNLYFNCSKYSVGNITNAVVYNSFSDYKTEMQKYGLESGSLYGDPFLDASFRPSSESPAIDSGIDLRGLVDFDYSGNLRPLGSGYDIGAFEYCEENNETEICDGIDNNCNGEIDEGLNCSRILPAPAEKAQTTLLGRSDILDKGIFHYLKAGGPAVTLISNDDEELTLVSIETEPVLEKINQNVSAGDLKKLSLYLSVAIIFLLVLLLIIYLIKEYSPDRRKKAHGEHHDKIKELLEKHKYSQKEKEYFEGYVKKYLHANYSRSTIAKACEGAGWDREFVNAIIDRAEFEKSRRD